MTAGSPVFVDTNVLVYFTFTHFAEHREARRRLAECESLPAALWTSRTGAARIPGRRHPAGLLDTLAARAVPEPGSTGF